MVRSNAKCGYAEKGFFFARWGRVLDVFRAGISVGRFYIVKGLAKFNSLPNVVVVNYIAAVLPILGIFFPLCHDTLKPYLVFFVVRNWSGLSFKIELRY